jgi:hypothetical protein
VEDFGIADSISEQSMDFLQHKSRKKKGYLPDEEDWERKQVRSEEMQTRAARQLYVLRQQVREVQNQLTRGNVDRMKHTKKVRGRVVLQKLNLLR